MSSTVECTLPQGRIRGVQRTHDAVFYSIPYASPITAETAFTAPGPAPQWTGVRDCTAPGPTCQKFRYSTDPGIPEILRVGEDQLSITLYLPNDAVPGSHAMPLDCPLPVFVWFHGGGFTTGNNGQDWWDGARFTRQGIIVAVVNYRLDDEGWLPLPNAPSNRGMRDQICALRWIQRTIGCCGGDPTRITIGGQSAGGTSVLNLAASPTARGLFTQVFACSPAFIRLTADNQGDPIRRWAKAALATIPSLWSKGSASRALTAQHLAQWSLAERAKLSHRIQRLHPFDMPYYPVIDEDLIPQPLDDAATGSPFGDYPLLIGAGSEEFVNVRMEGWRSLFTRIAADVAMRIAGVPRSQRSNVISTHTEDLKEGRLGTVVGDIMIRATVVVSAESRVRDRGVDDPSPTWVYDYRWPGREGARHCSDLPLWWGTLGAEGAEKFTGSVCPTSSAASPGPTDYVLKDSSGQALSDMMGSALARFIREGNPGWPAYSERTRICMTWDDTPQIEADSYADERSEWCSR